MEEIWKDISGYEGLYQISNLGRLRNFNGLVMRQRQSKDGYIRIQLFKDKKYKSEYVHILVAKAFIQNTYGKEEVNHIDGNKGNNKVDNLEWVTRSENARHAISMGLRRSAPMLGRTGRENPRSIPVIQYDLDGNFVKKWDCMLDAERFFRGKKACNIRRCINGKGRTAYGFIWKQYFGVITEKITVEPRKPQKHHIIRKKPYKRRMRTIVQYSKNGDFIRTWENANHIKAELGINRNSIYRACSGTRKTYGGYIWKYEDEAGKLTFR